MRLNPIRLACAFLSAAICFVSIHTPANAEPGDPYTGPSLTHRVKKVASGKPDKPDPREGWDEHKWSADFGTYGLSVTQRVDPETGHPPLKRQWGDSFVGIRGHKPYRYASANWSPWTFVNAFVTLKGDDKALPSPTLYGPCLTMAIRHASDERVVVETVWGDRRGGFLQMRIIARPPWNDRFGVALRYTPPPGEEVASIRYTLTCQPYDHNDRGNWQRRRWIATDDRSAPATDDKENAFELNLPDEFQAILHNRFAHVKGGVFLAVDTDTVTACSVRGRGNTMQVVLDPVSHNGWSMVLAGDWTGRHWRTVAEEFLTSKETVRKQIDNLDPARIDPPPSIPQSDHRDIDRLLTRHPTLADQYRERIAAPRRQRAELPDRPTAVADWVAHDRTRRELRELYRTIRTTWLEEKLWRKDPAD